MQTSLVEIYDYCPHSRAIKTGIVAVEAVEENNYHLMNQQRTIVVVP